MPETRRPSWRAFIDWVKGITPILQLILDSVAWGVAIPIAVWTRLDFTVDLVPTVRWLRFSIIAIGTQAGVGLLFGLYRRRWRYASFEEASAAARSVVLTTAVLYATNRWLLVPRYVPASVPVLGGFGALVAVGGYRYLYRILTDLRRRPDPAHATAHRALVFGAGEGGTQFLTITLRDRSSPLVPVALLDDDPNKRRWSIKGVKVVGTRDDIAAAAERYRADTLVIAIPSAGAELIAEITDRARPVGLSVKVLPSVSELLQGARLSEIRDVTQEDLLGRNPVSTDIESVAGYLKGKRVLVTGAGGYIGAELCRQVRQYDPAELIMVDRDESALHAVQLSLEGRALLDSPSLVLADLRDAETVIRVFRRHRPEVVFHAGALKHLTLLERHPEEAVKTNAWGTLTVLEAAAATGVGLFVNISTDKAADPCNVLGYSKRIAERLTAHFGRHATGRYLSVRFGNVLGSPGSVLTAFHRQIEAGDPVTVTHPEVTRYFMTVQEAVQLVVQAGAIGASGEVLILDMGRPVRIADVARRLVAESGRRLEVVYTGLRQGEKLHEVLLAAGETDHRPVHPKISHAPVAPLPPERVAGIELDGREPAQVTAQLAALASSLPSDTEESLPGRDTRASYRRPSGDATGEQVIDLTSPAQKVRRQRRIGG